MVMVFLVGICILTVAIIGRQHASMDRIRARIENDERREQ
jgi:hypothetical protein